MFILFGISIASIAEVFIGQYNGKEEFDKLAIPTWQMIWFALLFSLLTFPIAMFGAGLFLPKSLMEEGYAYFKLLMMGSFFAPLNAAVVSFFAGQGKTKVITASAIIGNVVNIILALVLVGGVEGWVRPLGASGAALATVASMGIQFLILLSIFLSKDNDKKFKTRRYSMDFDIFKSCIRIGLPSAVSTSLELAGWSIIIVILSNANKDYVVAHGIGNGFFTLFTFFSDGLNKAITIIASNMIGSEHRRLIKKLFKSALSMHFLMMVIPFIFLAAKPEFILNLFLDFSLMAGSVKKYSLMIMRSNFFFLLFCGLFWIIAAILRAGGDTRFVMLSNSICMWLAILGIYIALSIDSSTGLMAFLYIMPIYALANTSILFYRYVSNKWLQLKLD
jgi:MATE family multidrug resistance protein